MGELIIRRDGPVGRVVFSNPAKYNAMSYDMWMALPRALKDFDADPSIRLVVLEGDGTKAFVSGADISQFESRRSDADGQASYNRAVEMAYLSPIECSKPVIAKIRGICMGGGLGLAAACDLRFCSDDSRFRMPAARLGLGYNSVGVRRFLDVFGLQNTLDISIPRAFSAPPTPSRWASQAGWKSPRRSMRSSMNGVPWWLPMHRSPSRRSSSP